MWRDRWWRSLNASLHMGHFSLSSLCLCCSSDTAFLWWDLMCCTRSDVIWKEILHLAHQFCIGRPREDGEGGSSDCKGVVCSFCSREVLGQRFVLGRRDNCLGRSLYSKAELWKLSGRKLGRKADQLGVLSLVRLADISGIWGVMRGGCVNALFLPLSSGTSYDPLVVNAGLDATVIGFKSCLSGSVVQLSWLCSELHWEFWPLLKDFLLVDDQEGLFTALTQNLFTDTFSSPWVSKDDGSPSLSSVSDSRECLLLVLFASAGRFFLQFSSSRAKLWKSVVGLLLSEWISGMVSFFEKHVGFFMQKNLWCASKGNSKRKLCLHSEQMKP